MQIHRNDMLVLLLIPFLCTRLSAAELVYENGFESGDLSTLKCSGNCPEIVKSPQESGKYAGRFFLTRDMNTSYRTEVTIPKSGIFAWHTDYWIALDAFYDDWANDSDREISPFQIHSTPYDWKTKSPPRKGGQIRNGPLCMYIRNGEMYLNTFKAHVAWKGSLEMKKWMHLVVHFIASTEEDGLIELWKDGVKVASVSGPNNHRQNLIGEPDRPPYWKMGVYKWNWKTGLAKTDSERRLFFIDNFRIVKGTDGYTMVGLSKP